MGVLMDKKMSRYLLYVAVAAAGVVSCIENTSVFNRIEENKLRVIGVSYLPRPDVAPGDTVTARVYFAGNSVTGVDGFSCTYNGYGDRERVLFDEKPLSVIGTTSWLPDSFEYRFVLSDSVLIEHRSYDLDSLESDSLARLMAQPSDSVFAYILTLSEADQGALLDRVNKLSRAMATFCTAHSENGAALRILGTLCVRYHSRYPDYLPVNNNPAVSWIAAYAVPRSAAMGFSPYDTGCDTAIRKTYLYNARYPESVASTIVIDTGYSYFFATDNGIVTSADSDGTPAADTVRDLDVGRDGTSERESYACKWFFRNLDHASEDYDSLLVIDDNASGSFIEFRPPLAIGMRHFNLWAAVYDETGSFYYYRPRGMGVKGVSGMFEYTDAYRKSVAWQRGGADQE